MAIMRREDESTTPVLANGMPVPRRGDWTYETYAALPDDGLRYEIVQGVLAMAPAPEPGHQGISMALSAYLYGRIDGKKRGRTFASPIDVELSRHNVFQPDVLVILNEHLDRVQKKRIVGAPDLVVEIISPSSVVADCIVKRDAYKRAGVPEYWLVDPQQKTIEVFVLEHGSYTSWGVFAEEQRMRSRLLPKIMLPVAHFMS